MPSAQNNFYVGPLHKEHNMVEMMMSHLILGYKKTVAFNLGMLSLAFLALWEATCRIVRQPWVEAHMTRD